MIASEFDLVNGKPGLRAKLAMMFIAGRNLPHDKHAIDHDAEVKAALKMTDTLLTQIEADIKKEK